LKEAPQLGQTEGPEFMVEEKLSLTNKRNLADCPLISLMGLNYLPVVNKAKFWA
jgi:hypothetical protein